MNLLLDQHPVSSIQHPVPRTQHPVPIFQLPSYIRIMEFDILIIGKGLIGSATAKHLSLLRKGLAIIGPDEPADVERAIVFASHYDSGRVQGLIGRNDAMTRLNLLAVNHYPWLEKESGIRFHTGAGCLHVNPSGVDEYLKSASEKARQFGIEVSFYPDQATLTNAFPEFSFPNAAQGMYEPAPAGYINPIRLIQAQLNVFEKNGGAVFRDTVSGLTLDSSGGTVTTHEGNTHHAQQIILAAGAFSNFSHLLNRRLGLIIKSETVILARVSPKEAARLAKLPSLLYEIDTPEMEGIYSIQPIQYPDGNFYLKMGCNLPEDIFFEGDLNEVQHWFRNGDSDRHIGKMLKALQTIMPDLKVESCTSKRCLLPRTKKHENPYIGKVHDHLYVTTGNGSSAMCSDGVGKLMANLVVEGYLPKGFDDKEYEVVLG